MQKDPPAYPVGERITFFREQKMITVNKLATDAGLSQSHLRDIELGKKMPSVETLYWICLALGISLKDFFDDGAKALLEDEPVMRRIYQMDERQRRTLLAFLETVE